MRRYDILSGVLLIISITNFAIAAPVSLQEKHQARVDVVHIPKNATNVSSSSAPLRTEHGPTNVVQASADPEDDFDWVHWNDAVNQYINHPPPKEVGQVTGQSTGTGAYSHWNNPWRGNAEGLARFPETGQPTRLTPTKLDEHPDFMAANQPPLYPPPPTEFEYDEVNWPSLPKKGKEKKLSDLSDLPSQEEFDSHLYPGSVAPSRWAGARLPTVPKYELAPPPLHRRNLIRICTRGRWHLHDGLAQVCRQFPSTSWHLHLHRQGSSTMRSIGHPCTRGRWHLHDGLAQSGRQFPSTS